MSLGKISQFKNAKLISNYKNDLGLSSADMDLDMMGPPSKDDVIRRGYLGQLGEGDLLTNTSKDFFNGKPYNRLHDYNSYNAIFTLLSLSPFQKSNPSTYQGKIHADGNGQWGKESTDFYTILRSGGYNRNTGSSSFYYQNITSQEGQDYIKERNVDTGDFAASVGEQTMIDGRFNEGSGALKQGSNKKKDLFIEDVKFTNVTRIGNYAGTNITQGSFQVVEPHGVGGFYEELYFASEFAGHKNYTNASYLLVCSFIGRKAGDSPPVIIPGTTRYFPIAITNSSMSVTEAGATYAVQFKGLGAEVSDPTTQVLRENIKGPEVDVPSVGRILLHLFKEHNLEVEKITKQQKANETSSAEQQRAIGLAKSGAGKNFKVEANLPHRYCIWFPKAYAKYSKADSGFDKDGYTEFGETQYDEFGDEYMQGFSTGAGEVFPSTLDEIGYDQWVSYSGSNLDKLKGRYFEESDEKKNASGQEQGALLSKGKRLTPYSNYLSASRMKTGELAYSDSYFVPDLEKEITKRNDTLKPYQDEISRLEGEAQTAEGLAKLQQENLEAFKKEYQVNGKFSPDNLETESQKRDYAENIKALQEAIEEKNRARKAVNDAKKKLEEVKNNENTPSPPTEVVFFGKNRSTWQFRKGKSLTDLIHRIILDSAYVTELFTNQSKWSQVLKDGMVPWYRIETMSKTIGFDTVKNAPVYEFHYMIVPYQVHYSQLPGVQNGPLNYDALYKRVVREYNYIFTGKNLDILNLDLQFNNLFLMRTNVRSQTTEASNTDNQPKQNEKLPDANSVQALANMVGAPRKVDVDETNNDQGSGKPSTNQGTLARQLHDRMYSDGTKDLINVNLEIVGDPVYMIGSGNTHRPGITGDGLETDQGEVNFFDRSPYIKLNIGFPEDTPTANELKNGQYTQKIKYSRYGGFYEIFQADSSFDQGIFKQVLHLKRLPNQKGDFQDEVVVEEPVFAEEPKTGTENAPDDQIQKADKDPKVPVDGEAEENLGQQALGTLQDAGGFVVDTISDIGTGIGNVITSVGEGVSGVVNSVSDGVSGTLGKIYNSVAGEGAEGNQNQDANDGNDTGGPR